MHIHSVYMKAMVCSVLHWQELPGLLIPVFYSFGRASSPSLAFASCLFSSATPRPISCFGESGQTVPGTRRSSFWCDWLVGYRSQGGLENSCVWTLSPKSFSLSQQFSPSSILWIRESFLLFLLKNTALLQTPTLPMETVLWALGVLLCGTTAVAEIKAMK